MSKKTNHVSFKKYTEFIYNHPNYDGLEMNRDKNGDLNWVVTGNSKVGQNRIKWANDKCEERNIPVARPGSYAKLMFEIHPTKKTVCQLCGESMSIKYIYPGYYMKKTLIKEFNYHCNIFEDMYEISEQLISIDSNNYEKLKSILLEKFKLSKKTYKNYSIKKIIDIGEKLCRVDGKRIFSPGAMSNFPDRYDGFHSYNLCCRKKEDKGRTDDNLKTYNKDRRAYEYLSDGNIHAANQFMNSKFFKNASADHIGPISLGFIHDPIYIQKMSLAENSSKRDRLSVEDLTKLITIERKTQISAISHYGSIIWEFIKLEVSKKNFNTSIFRLLLKQNMINYMKILWLIIDNSKHGEEFIINCLIKPKMENFLYDYKFNEYGNILNKQKRRFTKATKKEYYRIIRVTIESIYNFNDKKNRNISANLSKKTILYLNKLYKELVNYNKSNHYDYINIYNNILLENQNYIISKYNKF